MYRFKYTFPFVLFLIVIPFKTLLAQNTVTDTTEADTANRSELDIKYDSILSKAAAFLSASAYDEAISSYKQAAALKPAEAYSYKMINYAEDISAKQKHADDLKRRAKIKDDLTRANNAIAVKSWDSAKTIFGEILTLKPEKADQDYAKSKIEAIDLELQRIAARVSPKPEPVAVVIPKNRREARAMRKIAERNAKFGPVSTAATPQIQQQVPAQANNAAVSMAPKVIQQKPAADTLPDRTRTAAAPTAQIRQKPSETSLPQKPVAAPTTQTIQKPTETVFSEQTAPAVKQTTQTSIETQSRDKDRSTSPATQKPVETSLPGKIENAAPVVQQTTQKQAETSLPQKTPAAVPAIQQSTQRPVENPLPKRTANVVVQAKQTAQKPTQTSLPQTTAATAPLSKEVSSAPAVLPSINLVDSSDYIKLTCQDISFIGANAYIKVLIQNYSSTASFPTDTLQVSIKKNNGTIRKLDQRFISSFPVITPLNENVFVSFADASAGIDPDDVFILEMRNKIKKTKLALQIPWSVYQQQKNL